MIYADYDYYVNTYMGNAIAEADYHRMATRAARYLDYITQGRAEKSADLEAVKLCSCALADQEQQIEIAQQLAQKSLSNALENPDGELSSQSVGVWSKSYRSGGESASAALDAQQSASQSLAAIARQYLAHTGLLYRGRRCEWA